LSIYKVQNGTNSGEKRIACSPEGRFWAIEVKKPGGKAILGPNQLPEPRTS
jgi:hypothetical protein